MQLLLHHCQLTLLNLAIGCLETSFQLSVGTLAYLTFGVVENAIIQLSSKTVIQLSLLFQVSYSGSKISICNAQAQHLISTAAAITLAML